MRTAGRWDMFDSGVGRWCGGGRRPDLRQWQEQEEKEGVEKKLGQKNDIRRMAAVVSESNG